MKKSRMVVDVANPGDVSLHHFVHGCLTELFYQALFFLRKSVPVYVLKLVLAMFFAQFHTKAFAYTHVERTIFCYFELYRRVDVNGVDVPMQQNQRQENVLAFSAAFKPIVTARTCVKVDSFFLSILGVHGIGRVHYIFCEPRDNAALRYFLFIKRFQNVINDIKWQSFTSRGD